MPAFDALQVAKELETAFSPEQAEALVKAFAHTLIEDLATKRDLADLERTLRADIERLDSKFAALDNRVAALEAKLDAQVAALRSEIRSSVADLKAEMIRWIVGAIAFNLLGTAGLMITLIKMIPH